MDGHVLLEVLMFLFYSASLASNVVFFILNLRRYKIPQAIFALSFIFMVLPAYFGIFIKVIK